MSVDGAFQYRVLRHQPVGKRKANVVGDRRIRQLLDSPFPFKVEKRSFTVTKIGSGLSSSGRNRERKQKLLACTTSYGKGGNEFILMC